MGPAGEKKVQRRRQTGKLSGRRRGGKEGDMGCWWTARSQKRAAWGLGGHQPQVNGSDAHTIPRLLGPLLQLLAFLGRAAVSGLHRPPPWC